MMCLLCLRTIGVTKVTTGCFKQARYSLIHRSNQSGSLSDRKRITLLGVPFFVEGHSEEGVNEVKDVFANCGCLGAKLHRFHH